MENLEEKYVNARINYCAAELGVEPEAIVELFLTALGKRALAKGDSDTIRSLILEYLRKVSENSSDTARLLSKLGIDSYCLRIRGSNVIHLSDESEELSEQRDMVLSWKPGSIAIFPPYLTDEMRERVSQLLIPETVEKIGRYSFEWMSIKELVFPGKMKEIPEGVCCGCHALETVVLPEGAIKIGHSAFRFCEKLKEIIIPSTVEKIEDLAFERCYSLSDETRRRIEEIGGEGVFGENTKEDEKEDES